MEKHSVRHHLRSAVSLRTDYGLVSQNRASYVIRFDQYTDQGLNPQKEDSDA